MLHHPNIIAYYDSFVADKALMIVMEYADGGTVFEFLQAREVCWHCVLMADVTPCRSCSTRATF